MALAFNKDPLEPVASGSLYGQLLVHLESPEELIDNYRSTTNLVADVYDKFKATRRGKSGTFEQEVDFLKYQLLFEAFLPTQSLLQAFPQLDDDLGQMGSAMVKHMQHRLFSILNDCPNSGGFSTSQELHNCPYLKIRASLMAADIFFYPQKAPTPSLNTDFDIVASILPYVDMLATENYMAELIRQSKLSQQFSARVYPMNQRTQLLEALENL